MKILSISFLFFLVSCGLGLDLPKHDSRFDPIVKQFSKDLKYFGVDANPSKVVIAFGDPEEEIKIAGLVPVTKGTSADGICITLAKTSNDLAKPFARLATGNYYGKKIIIIDEVNRDKSLSFLESLVYHELGHCALDYGHKNDQQIMAEHGVSEMGIDRFFLIREFMTGIKAYQNSLKIKTQVDPSEIIYEVDYEAFGQKIQTKLYYDERSEEYYLDEDSQIYSFWL